MSENSRSDHQAERRLAVITGAGGGMGIAAARQLGRRYRLILSDFDGVSLDRAASTLGDEGLDIVAATRCDVADLSEITKLAHLTAGTGALGALIHTAGVSPAQAGWEDIISVNLIGTANLLDAFLPLVETDTVAICIASMAAHMCPVDPTLDAIIDGPHAPEFTERLRAIIEQGSGSASRPEDAGKFAYALSKRAVLRMCEQRALPWAKRGGRIASISPGMIDTPMGRREVAENALAAAILNLTPVGRWGTPADIANAIDFLCSHHARFITGCDLRVDGGVTPLVGGIGDSTQSAA